MEDFVIVLPQTVSELREIRAKLVATGQENDLSVQYVDQLLADIKAGTLEPLPER